MIWGFRHSEIKYHIFVLCMRIIKDVENENIFENSCPKINEPQSEANINNSNIDEKKINNELKGISDNELNNEPIKMGITLRSRSISLTSSSQSSSTRRDSILSNISDQSLNDSSTSSNVPPVNTCKIIGKEKLLSISKLLDTWVSQMEWEMARDMLIDVRDLFEIHANKLSIRRG